MADLKSKFGFVNGVLCLLLFASGGFAQQPRPAAPAAKPAATTGRANVFSVSSNGGLFTVPQVQLPDAAVAAQLNLALVRAALVPELETPPQPLTARRGVQQAQAEYEANQRSGFVAARYRVLYNDHGLLSVAFVNEYLGAYPSAAERHATFDVRTGRPVRLRELVADTVALRRLWRQRIGARVAERLRTLRTEFPDVDAEMAADISQRLGWDAARRQVQFERNAPSFQDFAVTPAALVLYHDYEFPHVIEALEPAAGYSFRYAELRAWLRPQGQLGFRR